MRYVLSALAFLAFLAMALWSYSTSRDQANFKAAKNACEIGCVQDSGGIDQCRLACKGHPDHYP